MPKKYRNHGKNHWSLGTEIGIQQDVFHSNLKHKYSIITIKNDNHYYHYS